MCFPTTQKQFLTCHFFLASYLTGSPNAAKCHLTSAAAYLPSYLHIMPLFILIVAPSFSSRVVSL